MAQAESGVADYLEAQIAFWTVGTNLYKGSVRPVGEGGVPARAVFCIPDGGPPPDNFIGMSTSIRNPQVKIWVRGDRKKYEESLTDARELLDTLHLARISGYLIALVLGSDPTPMGEDADGHPEWTFNVVLNVRE